jgi:uncharacterized protein GlcG (DUF336 family)
MITLAQSRQILDGALAHARAQQLQPLAVIVLDAGGHPVAFVREDGASLFRHDIAQAKALGAIGMGTDTRVLTERARANPLFFQSVATAVGGAIAFSPGGVLIRDANGALIGAIGVSGDAGEQDEACARAGLAAVGLNGEAA